MTSNIRKIITTHQVSRTITDALTTAGRSRIEFGGSLLADENEDEVLIAYGVPTGPRADQGPAHIVTDADFQNRALRRIVAKYPNLTYVGDWHIHPMYLPQLSSTDRDTARGILLGEQEGRDELLLLLGTVTPKGDHKILAFGASLDDKAKLVLDELEVEEVADDSSQVTSRLENNLIPLGELLAPDIAPKIHDLPPQPFAACRHEAAERISADLSILRAELKATAELWQGADVLGALVERKDRRAVIIFPEEYPYGAPQIFAGSLTEGELSQIPLRYAWSSRHSLHDPVEEALLYPRAFSVFGRLRGRLARRGVPRKETSR